MIKKFKVIEVKTIERDGDNYEYVSNIGLDTNGNIVIHTSPNVLNAWIFNEWGDKIETEGKLRNQLMNMVQTYFTKKNHTISYKDLVITV